MPEKTNKNSEKGSVAVYVICVILSFIIILTGIFVGSASVRKNQLKTILSIKESYEKDNDKIEEIYTERENKDIPTTVEEAVRRNYTFNTNTKLLDSNRNQVTIPAGFKILENGVNSTQYKNPSSPTVDDGIVITDKEGNEFVWVPCTQDEYKKHEYKNNNTADKSSNIEDTSDNGVANAGWNTRYYRAYNDWNDNVDKTENQKSVANNKGFYIARYEAGVPSDASFYVKASYEGSKTYQQSKNNIGDTLKPVSKKGVQAWNLISQTNAKTVSARMYSAEEYGVRSQLVDGAAWDTIVEWIAKNADYSDKVKKDSTNCGNYYNTPQREVTGLYAVHTLATDWKLSENYTYGTKSIGGGSSLGTTRIEIATGLVNEFKLKNIYDMGGNVCEWTTEEGRHKEGENVGESEVFAIIRGGSFGNTGNTNAISMRNGQFAASRENIADFGFRVVLYVK